MKLSQICFFIIFFFFYLRKKDRSNGQGKRKPHTHKLEVPVDPNLEIELNDTFLVLAQTDEIEKYDYLL